MTIFQFLQSCWNCGRKAGQTCSGCGEARYCGVFCQHKDWAKHRRTCSNQEESVSPLEVKLEHSSPPHSSSAISPPKSV
ncbi:MAG: zinc finger MYND domain-containing protein [Gammaproteobacteria bacterium]|nr:zinc finger MYND domain-containing protein [Gammaproteobacteria bacterium]